MGHGSAAPGRHDGDVRRRTVPPASRQGRNESCPAFQRWVGGIIQYMGPVGTAEPRQVKPVSQPHANPRRHANTRRRDRPGGATNRACTHADARSPVIPSPRAARSVVPPGLLSYKAAPLPSDKSLGYYHMPLRGTGPPRRGMGRPLRRTGPPLRGSGSAATAHGSAPPGRPGICARRPPETGRRSAVM
jgi:hypothetical protein